MSDLGDMLFAKIFIQWLKKALGICVLTAFRPSFPHLETLKKILENFILLSQVRTKKKKKKKIDRFRPQFSDFGRVRAT